MLRLPLKGSSRSMQILHIKCCGNVLEHIEDKVFTATGPWDARKKCWLNFTTD